MRKYFFFVVCITLIALVCRASEPTTQPSGYRVIEPDKDGKVIMSDAEWKKILTPDQYNILREKGTEPAFHNAYFKNHEKGKYVCAGCGQDLFTSDTKFESGTGWPSFYQPIAQSKVKVTKDADGERDEVVCSRCGGHLGHVFDDGPKPTGLRYCMDSTALYFAKAK